MNKHVLALSTALSILAFSPAFAQSTSTTTTVDCTQEANKSDPACVKQQNNNTGTTQTQTQGQSGTSTSTTDQNAQSTTAPATTTTTTTGQSTTQPATTTTSEQNTTTTNATTAQSGTVLIVPEDRLNGAKVMSANDYIGKTVYDQNGKNIGDVNDLIISQDGQIQAVILGVGGFLGIGEKDVAVNTNAVKMVQDGDNMRLVVETTKEALNAAPTYDKKNRRYATSTTTTTTDQTGTTTTAPATTTTKTVDCTQEANKNDPACMSQQNNNTNATQTQGQSGSAATTTDQNAQTTPPASTTDQNAAQSGSSTTTTTTDQNAQTTQPATTTDQNAQTTTTTQSTTQMSAGELIVPADRLNNAQVMSANDYIGKTVYDQAGNNIGDVNDLIISQDGQIQAVILGVGGFLGIGEKDVAVNTNAVKMVQDGDNKRLVVETTKEALNNAPTYDKNNRRYAAQQNGATTDTTGSTTAPATTDTTTGNTPAAPAVDCSVAANASDPACVNKTQTQQ